MLQPTYNRWRSLELKQGLFFTLKEAQKFCNIHSNTTFDELNTVALYITKLDQIWSIFFTAVTSTYRYVLGSQSCLSAAA